MEDRSYHWLSAMTVKWGLWIQRQNALDGQKQPAGEAVGPD